MYVCIYTYMYVCIYTYAMLCLITQCSTICNPMDYSLPGSSVHGDSPDKITGVGCHALLQGIFPTQGSNPCLLCLLHSDRLFTAETPGKSDMEGKRM